MGPPVVLAVDRLDPMGLSPLPAHISGLDRDGIVGIEPIKVRTHRSISRTAARDQFAGNLFQFHRTPSVYPLCSHPTPPSDSQQWPDCARSRRGLYGSDVGHAAKPPRPTARDRA